MEDTHDIIKSNEVRPIRECPLCGEILDNNVRSAYTKYCLECSVISNRARGIRHMRVNNKIRKITWAQMDDSRREELMNKMSQKLLNEETEDAEIKRKLDLRRINRAYVSPRHSDFTKIREKRAKENGVIRHEVKEDE